MYVWVNILALIKRNTKKWPPKCTSVIVLMIWNVTGVIISQQQCKWKMVNMHHQRTNTAWRKKYFYFSKKKNHIVTGLCITHNIKKWWDHRVSALYKRSQNECWNHVHSLWNTFCTIAYHRYVILNWMYEDLHLNSGESSRTHWTKDSPNTKNCVLKFHFFSKGCHLWSYQLQIFWKLSTSNFL